MIVTGKKLTSIGQVINLTAASTLYVVSAAGNSYYITVNDLYNSLNNLYISGDYYYQNGFSTTAISGFAPTSSKINFATARLLDRDGVVALGFESGDRNLYNSSSTAVLNYDTSTLTGQWGSQNLTNYSNLVTKGSMVVSGNPPTTATSNGISGQIAIDGTYFYVATGTNKWGRVLLSTF